MELNARFARGRGEGCTYIIRLLFARKGAVCASRAGEELNARFARGREGCSYYIRLFFARRGAVCASRAGEKLNARFARGRGAECALRARERRL